MWRGHELRVFSYSFFIECNKLETILQKMEPTPNGTDRHPMRKTFMFENE